MSNPELTIRLLPVGLGDCILIRFPDASWAMVDCAFGAARRDAASMAVEFLNQQPPLDAPVRFIVATHPDTDHVGGIPAFLKLCKRRVEAVFHCGVERALKSGAKEYRYLDEVLRLSRDDRIGPVKPICAGQRIEFSPQIEGLEIVCLHPDSKTVARGAACSASERNNASVVLQITFYGITVLLSGDIEQRGWSSTIQYPEFQSPRVLKVSHHGAKSGLPIGEAFQKVFAVPEQICWALLSTPTGDPSKPHADVLQAFSTMPHWTTRCTGWSPHCYPENRQSYPFAPDDERCPRSLREALLAPIRGTDAVLYQDIGCCLNNEVVIRADGTIRHIMQSKCCSDCISTQAPPLPVT